MAPVVIIAIGTELTQGQGLDTNGPWLARELAPLGLRIHAMLTLPDEREALYHAISDAWKAGQSIVTIGGLGPTEDDRTRDVIAAILGNGLRASGRARKSVSLRYGAPKLSKEAKQQTRIPKEAKVLANEVGVAPGFLVMREGHFLASLPGPPREFKHVAKEALIPKLCKTVSLGQNLKSYEITTFGLTEPKANRIAADLLLEDESLHASILTGGGTVLLRWQGLTPEGNKAAKERQREARKRFGTHVVLKKAHQGSAHPLAARTLALLRKSRQRVAFAESCTGGMAAQFLTAVSGASQVFDLGVVSYANQMKQRMLGVSTATLVKHGAVSQACVHAMASGIMEQSEADITVSISGVAGPKGGTDQTPLGLVWFGLRWHHDENAHCAEYPCLFRGKRDVIRLFAALTALDLVRRTLESGTLPHVSEIGRNAPQFYKNE